MLNSPDEAEAAAATLRDRDIVSVLVRGSAVAWPKKFSAQGASYLRNVLNRIVK
jgi:hypothetical protein